MMDVVKAGQAHLQEQSAVAGANIRALRLRNRWTQAKLGELMGWQTNATV